MSMAKCRNERPVVNNLDEFEVDAERGLLPSPDPLECLPPHFNPWEKIAHDLPKLLVSGQIRSVLERLPLLLPTQLLEGRQNHRAMLLLSFLGHAYVWGEPQTVNHIPAGIAIPWYEVSQRLGRPPVLSYSSYALDNWRRLDPSGPIVLGNIVLLQNFLGGLDEEWFILVHVDIEAKAASALAATVQAQKAVNQDQPHEVAQQLGTIASAIKKMRETLLRMPESCDPYIYYNRVRPYIHGWTEDQFKDEKSGFTLEELDRAAPRNPVYIQRLFDRAYINSLAIKAAGITDKTPNPKRGKIVRDKNGKPTGLLTGRSWRLVRGKIPKLSFEQILASARAVTGVFNQVGVISVLDVGGGGSYKPGYKAFEKLRKDGDLTIRTFYTLFQPKPDKLLKQLKSSSPPVRKDDYYQLIGIGETFYRPLHDNTYRDFKTNPKHSANLRELADIAARKGWHVHMHATHDKSISHFLDIFEKVHKTTPLTPLRWVFAHADAVGPGSLARMRALGMIVAIHSRTTIQGRMYH